jgi:UDP-2-acetamido-3-amino-2,3-dideoxy-glucuronate N-acetyltransferase
MQSFVHPTAQLASNVKIGKNVFIGAFCILGFPSYQERKKNTFEQLKGEQTEPLEIGDNVKIFGHTVIGQNSKISNNCRIDFHSYIGEDTSIGEDCTIEYSARIYDNVSIGNNCVISGFISNDCIVKPYSIVQGDLIHKFKEVHKGEPEMSPIVESFTFIGRKAMIIGNIIIGEGSYIGAGAIVTKSTTPNRLYLGSPATDRGQAPKIYISETQSEKI